MALVSVKKLRELLKDVSDEAFLDLEIDQENGKIAVSVLEPDELQGCDSQCEACPNSCYTNQD